MMFATWPLPQKYLIVDDEVVTVQACAEFNGEDFLVLQSSDGGAFFVPMLTFVDAHYFETASDANENLEKLLAEAAGRKEAAE